MKILHLNTLYKGFIDRLENDLSKDFSYEEILKTLFSKRFALSDYWKFNLEYHYSYIVEEIFVNFKFVQEKWFFDFIGKNNAPDLIVILFEQIKYYKPDIIFDDSGGFLKDITYNKIKEKFPFIQKIITWDGYTLSDPNNFIGTDLLLTCVPSIQDKYAKLGFKTEKLPFAFDKRILKELGSFKRGNFLSFCGSVSLDHEERLNYLISMKNSIESKYFIGNLDGISSYFSKKLYYLILKKNFRYFLKVHKLRKLNSGSVYGLEMYKILAESFVTFNIHGDSVGNYAGNMRLFEATGVGTCLLTDWKNDLSLLFDPDNEVVTYKSVSEANSKLKELKNNPALRNKIALAGQNRTLKDHSYEKRVKELKDLIENL